MTASGAVLGSPFGLGLPFYTTTLTSGPVQFTVSMAQLNPDNTLAEVQQLAGGKSVTVSLTSSTASVGTISTSVTITGGSDNAVATFKPIATGTTNVAVVKPAGFTAPSNNASIAVTVR